MKSYETAADNYPICSVLSPSKMLKIPDKKDRRGSLNSDEAISEISSSNPSSNAESNQTLRVFEPENPSNQQNRKVSIDSGFIGEIGRTTSAKEDQESQKSDQDCITDSKVIPERFKKQALERNCERCQRKMSVKFDFDKMETEGDPEAWVLFSCSMCSTPTNVGHDTIETGTDDKKCDPITEQFSAILQDITVYYTKKLDMLK